MDNTWRETFTLWSETQEYHRRIAQVQHIIEDILAYCQNPYVAYSGGKDSCCLLHLVAQQRPTVYVFHWDYGESLMPRTIALEIQENIALIGGPKCRAVIRKRSRPQQARTNSAFGYRQFYATIDNLKKQFNWDMGFVGIRQEESHKRKATYTDFVMHDTSYPLLNLTWKDIWAYLISNKLPYPSVYDTYAPILGYDKARLVTFFDMEFEGLGSPYIDGVLMPKFRNYVHSSSKKKTR